VPANRIGCDVESLAKLQSLRAIQDFEQRAIPSVSQGAMKKTGPDVSVRFDHG
jgi:hypothetical protein